MQTVKKFTYFILGAVPATIWAIITLPYVVYSALYYPGILPVLGTIGLWLATFESDNSSKLKVIITMLLLCCGVVAMLPFSVVILDGVTQDDLSNTTGLLVRILFIATYISFISPILIAVHYMFKAIFKFASNKRLQSDAAAPRD